MCHQFVIIKHAELLEMAQEVADAAARRRLEGYGTEPLALVPGEDGLWWPRDYGSVRPSNWWPSDAAAATSSQTGKAQNGSDARGETKTHTQPSLFDADVPATTEGVATAEHKEAVNGARQPHEAERVEETTAWPGLFPPYAFPDKPVPLIAPTGQGLSLAPSVMTWGYPVEWRRGPVFNARLDTALSEKWSMWRDSLAHRRCLIPTTGFFESSETETFESPRTGRPVRRVYEFEKDGGTPFLMAGIYENDHFALMTVDAPARLASIHARLPLVLGADDAASWLAGDCRRFLDAPYAPLAADPA